MSMDRRQVQMNASVPRKLASTVFASGAARECALYSSSHIPYDYAPPPENVAMATIPYKWPSDEDWSRSWSWNPDNYPL